MDGEPNQMLCVRDIIEPLNGKVLCAVGPLDQPVRGGYACDLLSWVISRIETGNVWLTILNSANVIAVAVLSECSCVLLTEGVEMDEIVLNRARERDITVISTPFSTYRASSVLSGLLRSDHDV